MVVAVDWDGSRESLAVAECLSPWEGDLFVNNFGTSGGEEDGGFGFVMAGLLVVVTALMLVVAIVCCNEKKNILFYWPYYSLLKLKLITISF